MDPFTQRMLERAKTRREKLDNQKIALSQRSPLQEKNKLISPSLTDELRENMTDNNKGKQYITPLRKSKLQRLAQLYSGNDENVFLEDEETEREATITGDLEKKSQCKLGRLNELATKIKQWEDDTSHSKSTNQGTTTTTQKDNPKKPKVSDKQTIWDSNMVEKLCAQGFSRSESQSKLLYRFENKKDKQNETPTTKSDNSSRKPILSPQNENLVTSRSEVLKKAAFFESTTRESPNKIGARDPAELPLAERKALFERNKGEVVYPKNVFIPEKRSPLKIVKCERKIKTSENLECVRLKHDKIEEKRNFFEEKAKEQPVVEVEEVKQVIPKPPPLPAFNQKSEIMKDEKKEEEEEEGKKKEWTTNGGRLYPSLTNLDITDESEITNSYNGSINESKNSNLCLNMTLSDLLEMSKNNPVSPPADFSFSKSKECQVLDKMDKLLEDALNDMSSSEGESDVPSPPKMMRSSSFEYKSGVDDPNPLLHTVSFYRKQQKNSCVSPKKETDEENSSLDESQPKEENDESILVQNKIQTLTIEVSKQQTIISQASQALNLCLSTIEFSGSGEQVEGERLLLLASHKRQAYLNEIQRLKVENTLRPQGENAFFNEKGDVNITNISVKLKRDALRSIAAAENLQYFVCLVKSGEQVLGTPVVSATKENLKEMALQFPGVLKLQDLLSNFKITVEVYNLELSKELLPHDVKYHITNKKEKKLLTPIKSKKLESKLVKPNIQSPAGPNAVRTSNFQMCGYIVFSLREISRTQWILNKVPYISPVEGTICMTIQSELHLNDEFRGFLTMFDDISGFGAWHRRWCLLSSHFISYWKYPDDEQRKIPIGTIDLRSVITENVGVVSRDICARLNTFLIETTRPRLPDDQNSLVVRVNDDITTIRHLLSADSKQEMTTWCKKLNSTLALLRSWKCNFNE